MSKQLGYTINGTEITILANSFTYQEKDFSKDYKSEVNTIKAKLEELEALGKSKVVIIEGNTGSGKSLLAAVLHDTITDSKLIDVLETKIHGQPVALELSLATKAGGVFIIDGLEFATQESAEGVCKNILDADGTIIILTQFFEYSKSVPGSKFTLTRSGLVVN